MAARRNDVRLAVRQKHDRRDVSALVALIALTENVERRAQPIPDIRLAVRTKTVDPGERALLPALVHLNEVKHHARFGGVRNDGE